MITATASLEVDTLLFSGFGARFEVPSSGFALLFRDERRTQRALPQGDS